MAARALLRTDKRIGEIDHAERVASRPPVGQRVSHQPVSGRPMTRLAADAFACQWTAASCMAADTGGVFVGGHHGPRGIAGGEQLHDLCGHRLVKHSFGPRVGIAGGPDRIAALPRRMPLDFRGMAAGRRTTAGPEHRPRRWHGPGWIGRSRDWARDWGAFGRSSQSRRQQGDSCHGGRRQHGRLQNREEPGCGGRAAVVLTLGVFIRRCHATRLLAAIERHWRRNSRW